MYREAAKRRGRRQASFPTKAVVLGVLLIAFLTSTILLMIFFPVTKGSKDWLDILSAIGQATGAALLATTLYQIYLGVEHQKKKSIPRIHIIASFVKASRQLPGTIFLNEETYPNTPGNDYAQAWRSLSHESRTHFIKFKVYNQQDNDEAEARDFKVVIDISYDEGPSPRNLGIPPYRITIPLEPLVIPIGDHGAVFYVRCGMPTDPKLTHIECKILDYMCLNKQGKPFTGKLNGFSEITIPKIAFSEFQEDF